MKTSSGWGTPKNPIQLELCAIVGKKGQNIDAAEAADHIAGYTIFDNFSAQYPNARDGGQLGPTKG